MKIIFQFIFILLLVVSAFLPVGAVDLREASGVVRMDDSLYVVSDDVPGVYYEVKLSRPWQTFRRGLISIDANQIYRHSIPGGTLAMDLESLDFLGEGNVTVLSEKLVSLITLDGKVLQYDKRYTEFGNRGLEGVAIRKQHENKFTIAVLWEGGLIKKRKTPRQLRSKLKKRSFCPEILVHEYDRLEKDPPKYIGVKEASRVIPLQVPNDLPKKQRFRATDLVWQSEGKGFIVVLSSEAKGKKVNDKDRFLYQWLMRFDMGGAPYGNPIDIAKLLPKDFDYNNWEGLGWFEKGKKLILVNDTKAKPVPDFLVVQIPAAWSQPENSKPWSSKKLDPCKKF